MWYSATRNFMKASSLSPAQPPKLLPLLVLHGVAAASCFAFFTLAPIGAYFILALIGNDLGGPMFFPVFVAGTLVAAGITTAFLEGAVVLSTLLRRKYATPFYVIPLLVFVIATALLWPLVGRVHPVLAPVAGLFVALAFVVHWAAIATLWSLPRLLLRLFRVRPFYERTF